ncbi:hypothetical protein ACPPVV_08985 [Rhodanobacter sp. Col0626]|uniref:hypothetical protein n=1 Tax=Rhodanobacter sp. Col0626 TaxID=3415679 RepID=UPI003CEDAFC1
MKRHLNSLLQRRHSDFSDARNTGSRRSAPTESSEKTELVGVQDGYDWLALIKRESDQHAR